MLPPRLFIACLSILALAGAAWADVDLALNDIAVDPPAVALGADARFTLLIEGRRANGRILDLTRQTRYRSLSPDVVEVSDHGVVHARADGSGEVEIEVAGQKRLVPCHVSGSRQPPLYNFANDVVPLLSRFGCNSSGCHGKAEGQNGFKLSVFGFDPAADYRALVMEDRGRRVFPASAAQSLLLRKAAGQAPHGGGVRIGSDSREYRILHAWIAGGLRFGDAADPHVVSIALTPRERVLDLRAGQQLRVMARYSDGRHVDVTSLARFQSNNEALASVDESGLVAVGETPGQVAVMTS
ncbi:MAG TPA: hypothetical protein PK867_08480, partial [Pirellulales bacterium]|nr:hypothetical protein [Pirellulales bacterium]